MTEANEAPECDICEMTGAADIPSVGKAQANDEKWYEVCENHFASAPGEKFRRQTDFDQCYFGLCELRKDRYGMYSEEVGEFWNKHAEDSVLAHPDCAPDFDAIQAGKHPIWTMA